MAEVIELFNYVLMCRECGSNEFIVELHSANSIVVKRIVCAECEEGVLEIDIYTEDEIKELTQL